MTDDPLAYLRAIHDETELWATEASRSDGGAAVPGGAHWQWVDIHTDEVRTPAPDVEEFIGDGAAVSLRSRERWPTSGGDLPQFAIPDGEEVPTAVGGHIIRHDPARVLRRIAADRRILERHEPFENLEIVDMPKVGRVTRCRHDKQHWPCPDIIDLADGWGWTETT